MAATIFNLGSFCGAPLDRSTSAEHKDPNWEATALGCGETRFLLFSTCKGSTGASPLLLKAKPLPPAIAWQSLAALERLSVVPVGHRCNEVPPLLLGASAGVQHFALLVDIAEEDLVKHCDTPEGKSLFVSDGMGRLMFIGCDKLDFTVLGQAFAKITWHKRSVHDGSSGALTQPIECGLKRVCPTNKRRAYPRTDPTCIALVRSPSDDACLLIELKEYPGMWTCVSGFVEPGEQVEEAILREVWEETKAEVDLACGVTWLGSQPWPLGRGGNCELMLAAEVQTRTTEMVPNLEEVRGARWFTRAEVTVMLATPFNQEGKPCIPGETAIAHHLVRRWLAHPKAKAATWRDSAWLKPALVGAGCGVTASVLCLAAVRALRGTMA